MSLLRRTPIALGACVVLAALVLLPCLGRDGLWDPQERALADKVAPPLAVAASTPILPSPPPRTPTLLPECSKVVPKDAPARTLTAHAIAYGRDHISDDDRGRRLPLALLGLLTVLAAAGIAMRGATARAGVLTAVVLLSMPLLAFQSRFLTSEIGTACGATLVVYAVLALARPRGSRLAVRIADALVSTAALVAGVVIGFRGGGALLGLIVPLGAVAAAGGLGVPLAVAVVERVRSRSAERSPIATHLPALLATAAVIALFGLLAYQLYDVRAPRLAAGMVPAARQVAGHAIVNEGCYSWALGAVWTAQDDLRFVFDSTFEQAAYGTYPWGILGPIAMFALLRDDDSRRRTLGAVTLAWAGGAWIANEVFVRKSGIAIWAGFPAVAIAIAAWLEPLLTRRADAARADAPRAADLDPAPGVGASRGSGLLLGVFLVLAALTFGKDVQSFAEKLTSLVAGSDVTYPGASRLLALKTRLWVLVLGMVVAFGFALALGARERRPRLARLGTIATVAATLAFDLFWPFAWQPRLSEHLSSKTLFDTYRRLRHATEPLVIMGDLGLAASSYDDQVPEVVQTRQQIVAALQRPTRVFAIAPLVPAESCALNREMGEHPYFVIDDRNLKSYLLSNRVDGTTDKNPLRTLISRAAPLRIQTRPKARVVWDKKIELVGWALPAQLPRSGTFEVVTYYKVLGDVGGAWTQLLHVDGPGGRIRNGDHKPIGDRCPTSTWKVGDYITDRHTMTTRGGSYARGGYDVWIGFFTGTSPSFKNMPVSESPADMRDTNDRIKIAHLDLN